MVLMVVAAEGRVVELLRGVFVIIVASLVASIRS